MIDSCGSSQGMETKRQKQGQTLTERQTHKTDWGRRWGGGGGRMREKGEKVGVGGEGEGQAVRTEGER